MARFVTGISGIGSDPAPSQVSTKTAAIGWTIAIGTALAIFVGTLMLRPKEH